MATKKKAKKKVVPEMIGPSKVTADRELRPTLRVVGKQVFIRFPARAVSLVLWQKVARRDTLTESAFASGASEGDRLAVFQYED